jgi:hypothetical protein
VVDVSDPRGALVGTSACKGLPLETRLEIDPGVRTILRPAELAVLLMVLLDQGDLS